MATILKTDYDVKHYQNCLAHNLQLLDDLRNVTRVTIKKEEWEAPVMTFWRDDKQLISRVLDCYPKTKQAVRNKAVRLIAIEIKEVEAINTHIQQELKEAKELGIK